MSDLYLRQIPVGPMKNFAYLIGSKKSKICWAVDPAWEIDSIENAAEEDGYKIQGAFITHYHPDHTGGHLWGHDIEGVAELVGRVGCRVYANRDEWEGAKKVTGLSENDFVKCDSGQKFSLGGTELTCIHTPGHTPGSQCLLVNNILVAGDTLFISGCGRVDLPGGNIDQLYESLHDKIGKLPRSTILYPGHHYDPEHFASLETVFEKNAFLRCDSLKKWRMLFSQS